MSFLGHAPGVSQSYTTAPATTAHYVPHSDTTKAHYERLLLDLRRLLPPGVDDDVEDIADQVLHILCSSHHANATSATTSATGGSPDTAAAMVAEQQHRLERLLDTRLSREARDQLLQYRKCITDYVATDDDGDNGAMLSSRQPQGFGMDEFNYAGPSSSSSTSDDDDSSDSGSSNFGDGDHANEAGGADAAEAKEKRELALLSGASYDGKKGTHKKSKKKKKNSLLKADKNLMQYAFGGDDGIDVPGDGGGWLVGDAEAEDDDGDNDSAGADAAPKISFDEVACNPQYIKDSIRRLFPSYDMDTCSSLAQRVVNFLSQTGEDDYAVETQLTACLGGYEDEAVMNWIGDIVGSRWSVAYGLRYAQCTSQKEREAVMDSIREHAMSDGRAEQLYQSITGKEVDPLRQRRAGGETNVNEEGNTSGAEALRQQPQLRRLDLQACAFQDERSPHAHVRATVPQGTMRLTYETHDEVTLPPSATAPPPDALVSVETSFPRWAVPCFAGVTSLNAMQSKVYQCAFHSDENMLVSAPTGAGKTNVALMAMLHAIAAARSSSGAIDGQGLKMVYVAPMKALVQEVVRTFTARFESLGLTVAELSGDAAMTQQQMASTQLIVTTPEKWDIVTRKSVELGVASMLKLLIIDEVHLLHNERGPVLEAIVARTMIQQQLRGAGGIRIVGLSATLPNYQDVASFLQVDRLRGLFVFDSSYRPIPLEQTYCAIKKIKGMNQATVMNTVVYDKVLQAVQANEQVMIFVHSRRDTEHTARYLQKRAAEERRTHYFVQPDSDNHKALHEASMGIDAHLLRRSLLQLLPDGFGVHHAGLSREERNTVEQLFADRHLKVLVCTSTLAWGVNLPANSVIIKGTRVFNGSKGVSELLSALDVLQMFGRAGRVGFGAAVGRAAIITSAEDLHYYLSVLNQQLPIESQMMKRVVDMLNAEVALGHVETVDEGVQWLQRSYLYVRMLQVPEVYGIRPTTKDPLLLLHLANIVHTACEELRSCKMVDYDSHVRTIHTTPYGRIGSHCYVTAASMSTYLAQLSNAMQDVELFRVFASSSEFANISVRAEEQMQLKELIEAAPIAVRESRYTPLAKINILLQCYISRKELEGLPLMSEMVYVKDSAQRILRALYEVCLVREYGRTARQFLELYLMTVHRQWAIQSPIRQAESLLPMKHFEAILPALERVRLPWEEMRQWTVEDLGEKLSDDRRAQAAYEAIQSVPHYIVEAAVRPFTRAMLYVDVDVTPDFAYVESLHGRTVREVLLMIEHTNGRLLHHEILYLPLSSIEQRESYACAPVVVPMMEPRPTHLFVRIVSLHWLQASSVVSVCLLNTLLPPVAPPLRDIHQRPPTAEGNCCSVSECLAPYELHHVAEQIFPFQDFYAAQVDLIDPIFQDHPHHLFAGIPPGGGKTTVAELFVLQFLLEQALSTQKQKTSAGAGADIDQVTVAPLPAGKLLYLTSAAEVAHRRALDWRYKFGEVLKQSVVLLEEEAANLEAQSADVAAASIVLATGASLISLVRRGDSALSGVTHIIADHLHLLRAPDGQYVEECLSRLNSSPFLTCGGAGRARLLALSYPLISCAEVCRWLKIAAPRQFNYGPSYRQLRARMIGMEMQGARSRYESSIVAALKLLRRPSYAAAPAVIFVPTARNAMEVAQRVLMRCRGHYIPESTDVDTEDPRLALYLTAGVAYLHRGTSALDALTIQEQVDESAIHPVTQERLPLILVCSYDAAWRLPAALFTNGFICCGERLASAGDDESGEERGTAFADCSVVELLQMVSRAMNEVVVYCRSARVWVWGKLLNEPLPLESSLRYADDFRDAVNAAIAQGRAASRVDVLRVLSSHYFLYHLKSNLHFYGVPTAADVSLYASTFASHIVSSLKAVGCVEEMGQYPSGAASNEEEEEEEEDPHALLRPTVRGAALSHHCIAVRTVEHLLEVLPGGLAADRRKAAMYNKVLFVWRTIAFGSGEFGPAHLGDAVRTTEAAEQRALHTLARALPASMGVQYVDLDFREGGIKTYLLVLAYCSRLFPSQRVHDVASVGLGVSPSTTNAASFDAHRDHPFYHASATPETRAVLCETIPAYVAQRLADDLLLILPVARRVVAAAVELLDGSTQGWAVTHLMRLSTYLYQQTWETDAPLAQLPVLQVPGLLPATLSSAPALATVCPSCTLEKLQRDPAPCLVELTPPLEAALTAELTGSPTAASTTNGRAATTTATAAAAVVERSQAICQLLQKEAQQVPWVLKGTAEGRVEDLAGVLVMVVQVHSTLKWVSAAAAAALSPRHAQWWLRCVVLPKTSSATSAIPLEGSRLLAMRQLAIRVSSLQPKTKSDSEDEFELSGELMFPLTRLETEDLEAVDLLVLASSVCYHGAESAMTVQFEAESV